MSPFNYFSPVNVLLNGYFEKPSTPTLAVFSKSIVPFSLRVAVGESKADSSRCAFDVHLHFFVTHFGRRNRAA